MSKVTGIEKAVKQYIGLITSGKVSQANDLKNAIVETEFESAVVQFFIGSERIECVE